MHGWIDGVLMQHITHMFHRDDFSMNHLCVVCDIRLPPLDITLVWQQKAQINRPCLSNMSRRKVQLMFMKYIQQTARSGKMEQRSFWNNLEPWNSETAIKTFTGQSLVSFSHHWELWLNGFSLYFISAHASHDLGHSGSFQHTHIGLPYWAIALVWPFHHKGIRYMPCYSLGKHR